MEQVDTIDEHCNYHESATLRFNIPAITLNYINLPDTEINLKVSLLPKSSVTLDQVNNLLHSICEQVQVCLDSLCLQKHYAQLKDGSLDVDLSLSPKDNSVTVLLKMENSLTMRV
jgi:hypothetical protein